MAKQVTNGTKRVRSCIGCGKQADKMQLYRIVRTPDGTVCFDATGRSAGRGAYVCSVACLDAAWKARKLGRALKTNVTDDDAQRIAIEIASAQGKLGEVR